MFCWNLAVNCQYNMRLRVRQAHDRHLEAQRHFPQVQLLMTTIADHHHVVDVWACALLQKHQRTILVPGLSHSSEDVDHANSASIFTRILWAYNTLSLWLSVPCLVHLCWEIKYRLWILTGYEQDFLLHTWQIPTTHLSIPTAHSVSKNALF